MKRINLMSILMAFLLATSSRAADTGYAPTNSKDTTTNGMPTGTYGDTGSGLMQASPSQGSQNPIPVATVAPKQPDNTGMMMMQMAPAMMQMFMGKKDKKKTDTDSSSGTGGSSTGGDTGASGGGGSFRAGQQYDATGRDYRSDKISDADNDLSRRLAASAACGVGEKYGDENKCYKGVKAIIANALGKNHQCVRSVLSGEGAGTHGPQDLQKLGFKDDQSKCHSKGTILVYKGLYQGMSESAAAARLAREFPGASLTKGDLWGHIEVIGEDQKYHHFKTSHVPISENRNIAHATKRRQLVGCFVPDEEKIKNSPANKCGPNAGSTSCLSGAEKSGGVGGARSRKGQQ